MKRTLVFLFSALLLLGLFVSCDNSIDANKSLVKVKLGAAESKGLSASVKYASFDSLDWYYKADAKSDIFNYGEKSAWTELVAGLGSSIELSQGIWDFELKAVEKEADVNTAAAVYAGSLMGAEIGAQPNDGALSITIPVTAQMSGYGYIAFGDIKITLRNGETAITLRDDGSTATVAPNKAQIDSDEYDLPIEEPVRLSTGDYDVKVWYVDPSDNMVKAEESVKVTVFGGATTVIKGFLSEITQDVVVDAFVDTLPVVTKNVVETVPAVSTNEEEPVVVESREDAVVSNGNLQVTIPAGTILVVNEDNNVNAGDVNIGFVSVSNDEASGDLSIYLDNNSRVFEITLNVSQDNDTLVGVSTVVGKDLNIAGIYHNDTLIDAVPGSGEYYEYDAASGVLTLYIYHASYITILETDVCYVSDVEELNRAIATEGINTIIFSSDITSSKTVVVNRAVTIDGNGKKLVSTMSGVNGRAINISGANGVEIKNLTVEAAGERAFNIIQNATNVTLDNVKATANNYTVNVASSAPNAKVTVSNSTLTGLNVVNIAGAGSDIEITGCVINCNDLTDVEAYSALTLNKAATGAQIVATDCTFNIMGDSRIAKNDATDGKILVDNLDDVVSNSEAAIIYPGPYYYSFATLEKAIEFAVPGDTILLLSDVEASEIITINKPLTIDGNGKTLASTAGRAINVEVADDVIIKNLTIEASGERAINVINQPVKLVVDNVIATANNYAVMVATSVGDSGVPAYISITDSVLTGRNVVNVAAAKSVTTLNSCELNCMDKSDVEAYASLYLHSTASKARIVASNCTFNILGDSFAAYNGSTDGTIDVGEGYEVGQGVAYIEYTGGYTYSSGTLEKAIEKAKAGECVNLIMDIELDEAITVDKEITINLKGMNLSVKNGSDPIVAADGYAVVFSEGIYTISK